MKHMQKLFLSFLLFSLIIFSLVGTSFAQQIQYPIAQLGNCRDSQECFYYCEIPRNTPVCWSYGKYILHKDVLGDATKSPDQIAKDHGITFPIAELGNCNSPQECMQYCNIPANQQACSDFGHKKGLIQENTSTQQSVDESKIVADAKTQLGCNSKDTCMAFCNDPANQQKCQQFAQSEGLNQNHNDQQNTPQPSIPPTVFQATKQELGCDSETTCMDYCNNPDHYQKCQQFAQEHNLMQQQNQQGQEQQREQQHAAPSGASSPPPCADQASCMQWCKDNPDKCSLPKQQSNQNQPYNQNQYHGNGIVPSQPMSPYPSYQPGTMMYPQLQQGGNQIQPTPFDKFGGCTTDQDCHNYCQLHPDQCPGFGQNNQNNPPSGFPTQGQFIQPSGQQIPSSNTQQLSPQHISNPPTQNATNTTDQQKMCSQTAGCIWTGSTCSCSSGH